MEFYHMTPKEKKPSKYPMLNKLAWIGAILVVVIVLGYYILNYHTCIEVRNPLNQTAQVLCKKLIQSNWNYCTINKGLVACSNRTIANPSSLVDNSAGSKNVLIPKI